jgi:aryl-alcohol dehydrogenase-like predicted oxidoreductase
MRERDDNTPVNIPGALSRRDLLRTGTALGAAGVLSAGAAGYAAADPPAAEKKSAMPMAELGKTGMKVSRLAHGGSWDIDPEVLSVGFETGINYIDTAEGYRGGQSERAIGAFLKNMGATGHSAARKKLWLVSKTHSHHQLEQRLQPSLDRLQQDYVDAYYLHQVRDPKLLADPETKAVATRLKKSGKTRFFGFSTHDDTVVECLNAAADTDYIDVIMFRYDCHYYKRDDLEKAMDRCHQKGIGLVAMKTQVGGMTLPDKFDPFRKRGLNQHQAAIKAVAVDERIASICSEMTNIDHVKQNAEAVAGKLTLTERDAIQEHARLVSHLWCRGCEHLCKAASGAGAQLAVADSLRFLMYHDHYGKPEHARDLYAQLPADQRDLTALAEADWHGAEAACPFKVPLTKLMPRVRERLA